jgi:hypothetical protein
MANIPEVTTTYPYNTDAADGVNSHADNVGKSVVVEPQVIQSSGVPHLLDWMLMPWS